MLANRLSYTFNLTGPSYTIDSACSSSLVALIQATNDINQGKCDAAIVAGVNLLLNPNKSQQFHKLNLLSESGKCRSFDKSADGYVRSEAVAALFLQKSTVSKRIYAHVVHGAVNNDGYKCQSITCPSGLMQRNLMHQVCRESSIDPAQVSYVEAHGTGTKIGDREEIAAIAGVYGIETRDDHLHVGSVKSNMGHAEAASGVCAVIKVLLAFEAAVIPGNLHFDVASFDHHPETIRIVSENLPFRGDLAAVNSLGFGGTNAHLLLRANSKLKTKTSSSSSSSILLPRIVAISARTWEAAEALLGKVVECKDDFEFVSIIRDVYSTDIPKNSVRGYVILDGISDRTIITGSFESDRPIYYVFTGLGWAGMGKGLMTIDRFRDSISRCASVMTPFNLDLMAIIEDDDVNFIDRNVALAAVQIALVDLLAYLEITPEGYFGCKLDDLICAYVDDVLTLEQTMLVAYWRSRGMVDEDQVITQPNQRTTKWLSTTSPDSEALLRVPENAIVIEIGAGGQQQSLDWAIVLSLQTSSDVHSLLDFVGSLYNHGANPKLSKLYPTTIDDRPVGRGTPMISPLITWDHSSQWHVPSFVNGDNGNNNNFTIFVKIDLTQEEYRHLNDSRVFPVSGYLVVVWKLLAKTKNIHHEEMSVVFEDFVVHEAVVQLDDGTVDFEVTILRSSCEFEVRRGDQLLATGRARVAISDDAETFESEASTEDLLLGANDIYKELRSRGYSYEGKCKSVLSWNCNGTVGTVRWSRDWIVFLDGVLQLSLMQNHERDLFVPIGVQRVVINPTKAKLLKNDIGVLVAYNSYTDTYNSELLQLRGVKLEGIIRKDTHELLKYEHFEFLPYDNDQQLLCDDQRQALYVSLQIIAENLDYCPFNVAEITGERASEDLLCRDVVDVFSTELAIDVSSSHLQYIYIFFSWLFTILD